MGETVLRDSNGESGGPKTIAVTYSVSFRSRTIIELDTYQM